MDDAQWSDESGVADFEPIAIVGMAMRLPGRVRDGDDLWKLLSEKRSGLCEVPGDRFNINGFYDGTGEHGTIPSNKGYFLEDVHVREFDPSVFSIARKELERLDPSQRQLLQVAYECLENAGMAEWRGRKLGCYIGCFGEDWQDLNAKETQHPGGGYRATGYGDFTLANRISYEFDLHGPSMTVKTACSSSLVGLHLACAAIQRGECEGALVGGVSLIFSPTMWLALHDQGLLSPTGQCRTFDASADGYARGEAVNMILIKKASDAIRDGDSIRAIIRGTGINADGHTPALPTPSPSAQAALIKHTYARAGIDEISETAIFEAHGTGTPVGDPLETEAIVQCFGDKGVIITSIKPNVGHSEGAAGLSSLIKGVVALEHRLVPPNINFETPNPKIPFDEYRLHVPTEVETWPKGRAERISINSFGIGGSNSHVILESPRQFGIQGPPYINGLSEHQKSSGLILLSAYSSSSIEAQITAVQEYTKENVTSVRDLAYSLANRRENRPHRAYAVICNSSTWQVSPSEVINQLPPRVCWVFTGQGAQWPRMGAELLDTNETFRESIRRLDRFLSTLPSPPSWVIEDELRKDQDESRVHEAEMGHPLSLALQIGLVDVLKSWGITPNIVLGHSSGEMAAAYACGAISAESAISAGLFRTSLKQSQDRPGSMAAIGLGREETLPYLIPGVIIACENSQCSVTLSGDTEELKKVVQSISSDRPGVFARFLRVKKAYHSHHMWEYGAMYEKHLRPYLPDTTSEPHIPFYSSVTGERLIGAGTLGPPYWRRNMESPVLFNSSLRSALCSESNNMVLIEIGPHPALCGPIRQILGDIGRSDVHLKTLSRGASCHESMLHLAGKLFQKNIALDYSVICPPGKYIQDLPRYPWRRDTTHWNESRLAQEWRFRQHPPHELLGSRTVESGGEPCWRNVLDLKNVPWLNGHQVSGKVVFPAAGYITMIGEAIRQLHGEAAYVLKNVRITSAMLLDNDAPIEVVSSLISVSSEESENSPQYYTFTISSHDGSKWTSNCTGEARCSTGRRFENLNSNGSQAPLPRKVNSEVWYKNLRRVGFEYTGVFRGLRSIRSATTTEKAVAVISTSEERDLGTGSYSIHPSVIDRCFQVFTVAAYRGLARNMHKGAVPTFIEEIAILSSTPALEVTAEVSKVVHGSFKGSLLACCEGQQQCLYLKGFESSAFTSDDNDAGANDKTICHFQWKPSSTFADLKQYMPDRTEYPAEWPLLEELIALCVLHHQQNITPCSTTPQHLRSFVDWMRIYIEKYLVDTNKFISDTVHLVQLDSEARIARVQEIVASLSETPASMFSTAIYRLFQAAPSIFAGDTHPLGILLEDDILSQIYIAADTVNYHRSLNLIGTTNPRLRVLEVGAGTGGTTAKCLAALTSPFGERLYSTYTYTDVSSGFMNAAKERFADYDGIEYVTLDITKDPTLQGFQLGSYDLVICSNVLHATPSLQTSLRHVHKLLDQGGTVFLEELCPESKFINYIYGFLPGWWLGAEDGRGEQPYVTPQRWAEELIQAGFQNPKAIALDGQAPRHLSAGILASRESLKENPSRVTLLCHTPEAPLICEVRTCLESHQVAADICLFGQPLEPNQPIISLLDLQEPVFHGISEASFSTIMRYIQSTSACVVWVLPVSQVKCEDPRAAMTLGLARTARNELSLQLFTVEIDNDTSNSTAAKAVIQILFEVVSPSRKSAILDPDYEYAVIAGEILIPRLHWQTANEATASYKDQERSPFTSKRMEMRIQGLLKSMTWVEYQQPSLSDDAVLIEARAIGINFRDVLIAFKVLQNSTSEIGIEGSGVVRAVGAKVQHLSPGDHVLYLANGNFATYSINPAALCVRMPQGISFEQAAAIPCVYSTALLTLVDKANLRRGQSVLIQSACGGVGLAAIQIAQMIGADVYCTVSSEAKIQYLSEHYGIDRSHIFNSRNSSFLLAIMDATGGRGVDVVLNSLSGELLQASWQCVAPFGVMIEIGKRDFRRRTRLPMEDFEDNRTFIGFDLWPFSKIRPHQAAGAVERCVKLIHQGVLKGPTIAATYKATEVQAAFRMMQAGQHIGKVVVTMPKDPQMIEASVIRSAPVFRDDRRYLLVGGLGGLGRAVASWMVENGAREVVFLSRSMAENPEIQDFANELFSQKCDVHLVSGDVTNQTDVRKAVESGTRPLAGIINMAMVLKDVALSEMTLSDWNTAVEPKVHGTWNLHNAAPADLEFFVLFSSFSGIAGQWGQANYAAANTFLDAFVRYRRGKGLAASVIDIGVMGEVGFVSENDKVLQKFEKSGIRLLREQHLLDSLGLAIKDSKPGRDKCQEKTWALEERGHIMLGILTSTPLSLASTRVAWKRDARMAICHNLDKTTEVLSAQTGGKKSLKGLLLTSEDVDEGARTEMVAKAIAEALANFLIRETDSVAIDAPLAALGMDSLVAIELRNWIRQHTGADVSVFTINQSPSLLSLADNVQQGMRRTTETSG